MNKFCVCLLIVISACAPREQTYVTDTTHTPSLSKNAFTTSDGKVLSTRSWLPSHKAKAVIIALHGFNDYSNAFSEAGRYFANKRIAVYAYDQRGFGNAYHHGIWPGSKNLARDLAQFIRLIQSRHRHTPVYILGESMGGAVAVRALASEDVSINSLILVAPAMWGGPSMNAMYDGMLWLSAHSVPYWTLTGGDLHIVACNNMALLRRMSVDPLVIKETRIDAVYGLVSLMNEAYRDIPHVHVPTLLLYGGNDQVIPRDSIEYALPRFTAPVTFAYYPNSYHMMLRDLQGADIMSDIASWVEHPTHTLKHAYTK